MKVLNFGSLNKDYVYIVEEIVAPGQTIASYGLQCYPGGKGLNQTIALARADVPIFHAGIIGEDGRDLKELLEKEKVDCSYLKVGDIHTGTAFIQVAANGQNSIVLNGGANRTQTEDFCEEVLTNFKAGDILLLQNEINCVQYLIDRAYEKGLYIVFNPSPMNEEVLACDLEKIALFILNEEEGKLLTGEKEVDSMLAVMKKQYPTAEVVLTLGSRGAIYQNQDLLLKVAAYHVKAIDTTAAGDTFTGYFVAGIVRGMEKEACLQMATKAAALAVTKRGAASSIPTSKELI